MAVNFLNLLTSLLFSDNEHEIEKARKLAKELNMECLFNINCVPDYSPVQNSEKVKELTDINFPNDNVYEELKNYSKFKYWFFCSDLFFYPYINFNGYFFGCCVSCTKYFGVDVFKLGLKKALRHPNIIYAKAMLLTDFLLKPKKYFPCEHNCRVYEILNQNNISISKIIFKMLKLRFLNKFNHL